MDEAAEQTQETETLEPEVVEQAEEQSHGETPEAPEGKAEDSKDRETQPDDDGGPYWVEKRLKRYSERLNRVKGDLTKEQEEKRNLEERLKLMELALQQKDTKPKGPPDPESYDGGAYDPQYAKDLAAYQQGFIQNEVQRRTSEISQQAQEQAARDRAEQEIQQRIKNHWQHAQTLKAKDYEQAEEAAIEILGDTVFNDAVRYLDPEETSMLFYHLGKNPNKARDLAAKIATNPVKATVEMGRVLERLKNPAKSSNPLPQPDDELEGGGGNPRQRRGPKGAKYE